MKPWISSHFCFCQLSSKCDAFIIYWFFKTNLCFQPWSASDAQQEIVSLPSWQSICVIMQISWTKPRPRFSHKYKSWVNLPRNQIKPIFQPVYLAPAVLPKWYRKFTIAFPSLKAYSLWDFNSRNWNFPKAWRPLEEGAHLCWTNPLCYHISSDENM